MVGLSLLHKKGIGGREGQPAAAAKDSRKLQSGKKAWGQSGVFWLAFEELLGHVCLPRRWSGLADQLLLLGGPGKS